MILTLLAGTAVGVLKLMQHITTYQQTTKVKHGLVVQASQTVLASEVVTFLYSSMPQMVFLMTTPL